MNKKNLLICSLMLFVLSGCVDMTNIEDRGFIVGAAVDMAAPEKAEKGQKGQYSLALTNQYVVPSGLSNPQQGASSPSAYKNITGTGSSLLRISQQMDAKTSKMSYYEHIKVLLVSEEVARNKRLFASITDIFIRDPEMRRDIKVLITKGKAKDFLTFNAKDGEQLPAIYLDSILENTKVSKQTIKPIRLGKVHEMLLGSSSFAIPMAELGTNYVDINGAAIFHGYDNTFAGKLKPEETYGFNLITSNMKGGGVEFEISKKLMSFEFMDSRAKVHVDAANPKKIDLYVDIEAEGRIDEMFGDRSLLDERYLDAIQKKISARIKKITESTIHKTQKKMNTDVFGFGSYLYGHDYKLWKHKIEPNWERGKNLYANADVHVSVTTKVRTVGNTDRAKIRRGK